ncbi:hypothetical protein ACFL1B_04960 [Nanoarchaeota archaeon]
MKEASWDECITSSSALKTAPDPEKAKSLLKTAKARIEFLESNELNEKTCNFIFEGYYSSVLEVIHSLAIKEGFKVNNHLCIGYYLRDYLVRNDLYVIFDDCRYKRNSLVYYGETMPLSLATDTIKKLKELLKELKCQQT